MSLTKDLKDFFNPQDSEEMSDQKGRFVLTGQQLLGGMMLYTVTDQETGVSYLTKPGSNCPLTPLLDADGKPVMTRF